MITITGYKQRQRKDGTNFIVLELSGGVELVQSTTTGQFRAVIRRTTIPASFDEQTAKSVIGTQMPGSIVRVQSEPYEFTDGRTAEVITLSHTYAYQPEGSSVPMRASQAMEEALM